MSYSAACYFLGSDMHVDGELLRVSDSSCTITVIEWHNIKHIFLRIRFLDGRRKSRANRDRKIETVQIEISFYAVLNCFDSTEHSYAGGAYAGVTMLAWIDAGECDRRDITYEWRTQNTFGIQRLSKLDRNIHVEERKMFMFFSNLFSKIWLIFGKLWEARSWLYRRQILQVNTRLKAL